MPRPGSGSWGRQKPPPGSRLLAGHPLASGLAAFWACNEGGGPTLSDATGRYPAASQSAARSAGTYGPQVTFAGGTPAATGGVSPTGDGAAAMTWGVLFRPTLVDGGYHNLIYRAGSSRQLWLGLSGGFSSTVNGVVFYANGFGLTVTYSPAVAAGDWHLAVATFDGSLAHLYLDGVPGVVGGGTGMDAGSGPVYFGAESDGSNAFTGDISAVCAWTRCLSPAEVPARAPDLWSLFAPPPGRRFFVPVAAAPAGSHDWLQFRPEPPKSPPRVIPY